MSLPKTNTAGHPLMGKQYWRSLNELAGSAEFRQWLEREFQDRASELTGSGSRRTLLKLMAASLGLAGLTACRRPEEKILPSSRGVEDYIPGNPLYYATSMELGGIATGLIVEAHDGRPTKIEGNPLHPDSLGACSAWAQASVLALYDPDRDGLVLREGKRSSWKEFSDFAGQHFQESNIARGEGLWLLSSHSTSPSLSAVRGHLLERFPEARWAEFEPISRDTVLAGAEIAFGQRLEAHYNFESADVVLALDCDFLGLDAVSMAQIREFSRRRALDTDGSEMNRLYVAESQFSATGAMADHRFRVRSSDISQLAINLAAELGVAESSEPRQSWIPALARDLASHRGRSIVIAGSRQPAKVHALVHLINDALRNNHQTINFTQVVSESSGSSIQDLAAAMADGQVNTLVILGSNPVFTAPADLEFAERLEQVQTSIHLGQEMDETGNSVTWRLPEAHYLESWGDDRALDGTVSLRQPLIEPLYEGKTAAEVLALLGGFEHQRAYDVMRNYWSAQWTAHYAENMWRSALHDGIIQGTAFDKTKPEIRQSEVLASAVPNPSESGLEVVFHPSASVYDGRFANNGWLQETPDPMTKLTWDNAALISPSTAQRLGVKSNDIISMERGGRSMEVPVLIMPGQADDSISVALGYGRSVCGRVGQGVGHNPYLIRTSDDMGFATGVSVRKTGGTYKLVSAQDHHAMEGRPLVREATLEEYREHPDFAAEAVHHPPLESLYESRSYNEGNQWGMAIDLNRCVGCNACVLACQAENNIPIVGKKEVSRGREMHWIRVDRYFSGSEEDPEALFQPVTCHHCENAPCENVCPVAATSHSPEGLNDMAYNRCVGTRYCSNNCPFKVRRFNFFNWHKDLQESGKLVFNPDVTVRMRGVMEKCTYCVQRIQEKKIQAKAEGRRQIRDGEIVTACQQSCPAEAIIFGNINDPESRVSKLKQSNRDYAMLEELNIRPRTSYLARVRNPNPELA